LAAFGPAELLQIMTGDESAHAKADHRERLLIGDLILDFLSQVFGE
jgi:hypothetical protein